MDQRTRLAILNDCLTVEDWAEVCIRAIERAKNGDGWARAWLSDQLEKQDGVDGPGMEAFDEMLEKLGHTLASG